MSETPKTVKLSPLTEGFIGLIIGSVIGGILRGMDIVSIGGGVGIGLGMGLASWFNAYRRAKKSENEDV